MTFSAADHRLRYVFDKILEVKVKSTMERKSKGTSGPKKRITNQRSFEIEMKEESMQNLLYFIKQELAFYNHLVEQLTPRLRSSPGDFTSFKDKERRLWEGCAEHAADIRKMIDHPVDQWPEKLRNLGTYLRTPEGETRISPGHAQMISVACFPARIHPLTRRMLAADVMRYMSDQAENISIGNRSDSLKAPLQMLNTQTIDTKRHLQIPAALASMRYDEDQNITFVRIPYTKQEIEVHGYDLTEIAHKMLMIRAPHPNSDDGRWRLELRDNPGYSVLATDFFERRRR